MALTTFHVCYHCKDRTFDCHSKCELYQKEVKENAEVRKNVYKQKELKSTIENLHTNRILKLKHEKGSV